MFKSAVLCVGSATVDTFLTIESPFSSIQLGDKVLVQSIEKHSGGGATNSAAAFSKLGLKVKVLTKLGNDHDADFILKELKKYKVKNVCRHQSKRSTDAATILSSLKDKDRIIFVHKGASADLSVNDFKTAALKVQWIYLASLMGKSFQVARYIVKHKKEKVKLLFNPSLYLAKRGKKSLQAILKATEILVLNKEEAQALLKNDSENFIVLLKRLQHCGPKIVIITDGSKKMWALTEEYIYSLTPPDVKVVCSTGAGDAFTAGFLAGIIKNYSFADALKLGQVNATSVIQHIGAKNKLLTENEAKDLIKKYNLKVAKIKITKNK